MHPFGTVYVNNVKGEAATLLASARQMRKLYSVINNMPQKRNSNKFFQEYDIDKKGKEEKDTNNDLNI